MPLLTCPADGGRSGHSPVSRPKAEALPSSPGKVAPQSNNEMLILTQPPGQMPRSAKPSLGKPWLCLYPLASSSRGKMGGIVSESCGRDPTGPQAKGAKEF